MRAFMSETHPCDWHHGNFDICPVTGEPMQRREIHTRHDRPGFFNTCSQCDPGSLSLAESLSELNRKRKAGAK